MDGGILSQLKYVIFFMVLIFGVPIGYYISKKNIIVEKVIFFLAIFFTCVEVTINFVSMETYRGTSKGFEIGLVDLSVLVLFFLVIHRKKIFKIKLLPPGSILYIIYFAFSLISYASSEILFILHLKFGR